MNKKEFPFTVIVPGVSPDMTRPIPRFSWAVDKFGRDNFTQHTVVAGIVTYHFKNEQDAAFFALKWANVNVD